MLDSNLAADEGKLEYLGQMISGKQAVINVLQHEGAVVIKELNDRFTLSAMLDRSAQDYSFIASYLYCFGMLTIAGKSGTGKLLLTPPNLVTQRLYADQILRFLLTLGTDRNDADVAVDMLLEHGDLLPLLTCVEQKLFPIFSNRDYKWLDEFALKMAFTTLLFNDVNYAICSEPELSRGYADLCLILRPDARQYQLFDMLFEFKYVSLKTLNLNGEQVDNMTEQELLGEIPVKNAFEEARAQLKRYARALQERFGEQLRLKTYIVVSIGFERLLGEEIIC